MFGLGITELLVILAIVVLLFGTSRLGSLGNDLGSAIKGFRSAIKDDSGDKVEKQDDDYIEGKVEREETRSSDKP